LTSPRATVPSEVEPRDAQFQLSPRLVADAVLDSPRGDDPDDLTDDDQYSSEEEIEEGR
jgi:hypothetical protein